MRRFADVGRLGGVKKVMMTHPQRWSRETRESERNVEATLATRRLGCVVRRSGSVGRLGGAHVCVKGKWPESVASMPDGAKMLQAYNCWHMAGDKRARRRGGDYRIGRWVWSIWKVNVVEERRVRSKKVGEVEGRWVGWLPGVAITTLESFGAAPRRGCPTWVVGWGVVPPPTTSKEGCVYEVLNA